MTPKEKAKELVEKYMTYIPMQEYEAKQCALIAVDEIIALNLQYSDIEYGGINSYEFWEQVKTEIENI